VIQLRVPGTLAYRHIALRAVSEACKMAQNDQGDPWGELEAQTVSAVGEAFNNIAIHSYEGMAPGFVEIAIEWTNDALVIQITDTGHSFDPSAIEPPDLDQLPECGMGLFIMSSFMDRVDYRPGPPNVLQMTRFRATDPSREDRASGIMGPMLEAPQPIVTTTMSSGGEDNSTSRSDWRIKVVDPVNAGARVVGGSRRG
jgi:serine/threonine-protein kinase RsbW